MEAQFSAQNAFGYESRGKSGDQKDSQVLQHELTKQALGLNGDLKLSINPTTRLPLATSSNDSELTHFARHENLLDDEFDDAFESQAAPVSTTVESAKPVVLSKDINEINRIWNEKKNKIQTEQASSQTSNAISTDAESRLAKSTSPLPVEKPLVLPFADRSKSSALDAIISQSSGSVPIEATSSGSFGLQNSGTVSISDELERPSGTNEVSLDTEVKVQKELEELRSFAAPKLDANEEVTLDEQSGGFKSHKSTDFSFGKLAVNIDLSPVEFQDDEVFEYPEVDLQTVSEGCSEGELLALFESPKLDFSEIQPVMPVSGWKAFKKLLTGPPKLHKGLIKERDSVFALAKMTFDPAEDFHVLMLRTTYNKLTNSTGKCARTGSHWSNIGFQGNDPSTDFRACGILGLAQLALFAIKYQSLAQELLKISQHSTANFPFAVLSINLTKVCLQILREEKLNRLCNSKKQVIPLFNDLFFALWVKFHAIWSRMDKNISHFGYVMNDLENSAGKEVKSFIDQALSVPPDGKEISKTSQCQSADQVDLPSDKKKTSNPSGNRSKYAVEEHALPEFHKDVNHAGENNLELNFTGIVDAGAN